MRNTLAAVSLVFCPPARAILETASEGWA